MHWKWIGARTSRNQLLKVQTQNNFWFLLENFFNLPSHFVSKSFKIQAPIHPSTYFLKEKPPKFWRYIRRLFVSTYWVPFLFFGYDKRKERVCLTLKKVDSFFEGIRLPVEFCKLKQWSGCWDCVWKKIAETGGGLISLHRYLNTSRLEFFWSKDPKENYAATPLLFFKLRTGIGFREMPLNGCSKIPSQLVTKSWLSSLKISIIRSVADSETASRYAR